MTNVLYQKCNYLGHIKIHQELEKLILRVYFMKVRCPIVYPLDTDGIGIRQNSSTLKTIFWGENSEN